VRLLSVIHGPAFGGAHNQARVLAEPLRQRGIDTQVVLPEEAGAAATRLNESGVACTTMPLQRLRASADPRLHASLMRGFRQETRELARIIREDGIDVVQIHGATNPHGAVAAHGGNAGLVWQLFDTRAPMPLRRLVMPWVIRKADAITTWGQELARVHPGTDRLGERVITVYPPIEQGRFAPDANQREVARKRLGIETDLTLIGNVGVLNPQKGHEHLIRAAEIVRRDRSDARFCILGGSSPAHADYERSLHSEVAARGLRDVFQFMDPGTDVPLLIQAFDVFAMTSVPRSEGMPTAILEAMACEKPVVATDVGAVAELVHRGVTGTLVPPERADRLASAILDLMAQPERMAELGRNGLRRASTEFGIERLADLHMGAYEIAVSRRDARKG
jgi:glycosyltransferase involved in cell wall biosynthesis